LQEWEILPGFSDPSQPLPLRESHTCITKWQLSESSRQNKRCG
jgi:hypothetical protein